MRGFKLWVYNYICLGPTYWEIQKHQGWVSEMKRCQIFATLVKPDENSGKYHRNDWKRLKYSIHTALQKAFLTQSELHCLRFPHKWLFDYNLPEKCLWKDNWHHTQWLKKNPNNLNYCSSKECWPYSKCQRHLYGWIKTWNQNFLTGLLIINYLLKSNIERRFLHSPGKRAEWLKDFFPPHD